MRRSLSTATYVWPRDRALDREAKNFDEAIAAANDEGKLDGLPLKNGILPWLWEVRGLPEKKLAQMSRSALHDLHTAMELKQLKFSRLELATYEDNKEPLRYGLLDVKNAVDFEGKPFELKFEDSPEGRCLTEDTVQRMYVRFGPKLMGDIGRQVILITNADPF